jgi:ABC-type sugar transport system ATPase subunit
MPKIDYDKLIKKELGDTFKDHIVPNPPYLPQHPLRMTILGPSGCGKTTLLFDLFMVEI